jgi:hypothetical protein
VSIPEVRAVRIMVALENWQLLVWRRVASPFPRERGRVRVARCASCVCESSTPHLGPLLLPRGETEQRRELTLNEHYPRIIPTRDFALFQDLGKDAICRFASVGDPRSKSVATKNCSISRRSKCRARARCEQDSRQRAQF